MKIDFKKIINIKNKEELREFPLTKPIFQNNYLFHYLIQLNNLPALKLEKVPVYLENNDNLNGFHIAAKENNIDVLYYLIETYPDYIYNRNDARKTFMEYLEIEKINGLINKFPKLNWVDLIDNSILAKILVNLKYSELNKFIKLYGLKPHDHLQYLFAIVRNTSLKSDDKIKILDDFTYEEINIKNDFGLGLIFSGLDLDDEKLFDYLLNRNIDIDYYTFNKMRNPLIEGLFIDIMNSDYKYSKKIFDKIIKINPLFYKTTNKFMDNILHTIIYIRINKNNYQNYSPDFEILSKCDSDSWNQENIDKISPLDLLIKLNYDIYSKILIDNKIAVNPIIIERINIANLKSGQINIFANKWIKLYETLPKYSLPINNVIIETLEYTHSTLFQAKFTDIGIFNLYLESTYTQLLIPNMQSYLLNNLTFENTFPFSDDLILKEPIFPWVISYYSEFEYYIHPYLNNLINGARYQGTKRFCVVFLSLIYDEILHANILIYDFKNMSIERFEPYGNTSLIENTVDDILEEELTWNTGLKYLRPKDYLPYAGFQTISDENNLINKKAGDFGGFCLAWCLWYLESKIKNPDISSKILVEKLINKLNNSELKFSEYIRNYSNKINEKRVKYLKEIGLNENNISNTHITVSDDIILTNFLINKYNGKIDNKLDTK